MSLDDRDAFAEMVRRYQSAIVSWARYALDDQDTALEAARIVCESAWTGRRDAPTDLSRWLLEISFAVAAEMGHEEACDRRDLHALWVGGIVKTALDELDAHERDLLTGEKPIVSSIDGIGVGLALHALRDILNSRGVIRVGIYGW